MKLKANLMLLLAAAIWGFAFVAQRVGMDYIGPFAFNGLRFTLGCLSLVPLLVYFKNDAPPADNRLTCFIGIIAGIILFAGASLQQIGLIYTTAGKAAFITCLYIVLVPILGIFLKQHTSISTWLGSLLAIIGLFLLCVKENLTVSYGDLLELMGAVFWAIHILFIDHYSRKIDTLKLAFFQFATCAVLSLLTALCFETITWAAAQSAAVPLLYGGICSVGIAYTLQIVGQKSAAPAHAAIILSMETVFAALGGYLILDERLLLRDILGCIFMMSGMLISQIQSLKFSGDKESMPASSS